MNPRDAYLAYQAEIGTEEVVLTQPWIKPRPAVARHEVREPSSAYSGSTDRAPAFSSAAAGADFFQSIAATLSKPEPVKRRPDATPSPLTGAPKPSVSPAPFLPDLQNLDAYWAFLEASCPVWFPGTPANLVRAEGSSRPALALVELFPTGDGASQVFGGEAGEFLDKMMKGIGLTRDNLYLTSVMKTTPPGKTWARKDVARMLPAILRELELAGAGLVLLLGEACAQGVLRTGKSLAALAETAENHGNMTMVATEHPSVLMSADDTARRAAWNQLKWLRARLPSQES